MAVRVTPGLEVIADENAVEAMFFGCDCEIEQGARTELFGRRLVTQPQHAFNL
jgi:hypothetical protein